MISRFRRDELSVNRIFSGIGRRASDLPHQIAWWFENFRTIGNRRKLERFKNIRYGERCFILANGPSLTKIDLDKLSNEYSFGLNRLYLLFDKFEYRPTYYVCINELVLDQFSSEIDLLNFPKFLNWNRRKLFNQNNENTVFIKTGFNISDLFSTNLRHPLSGGGTVTYIALQLAYYMGFNKVILVGLDHNFGDKGIPNKTEVRSQEEDTNHFAPNYFPKGVKWQLPDLLRSEIAYKLAREAFEKDGRQILDATIGGKCEVFEKIDFESLF